MIVWVLIALGINSSPQSLQIDTATEVFMSADKCMDSKEANEKKAKEENKYKAVSFQCFKREVQK